MELLSNYIILHYKLPPKLSGLKQQILLSSWIYNLGRVQEGLHISAPLTSSWDSSLGDQRIHFQDGIFTGLARWFSLWVGSSARVVGRKHWLLSLWPSSQAA